MGYQQEHKVEGENYSRYFGCHRRCGAVSVLSATSLMSHHSAGRTARVRFNVSHLVKRRTGIKAEPSGLLWGCTACSSSSSSRLKGSFLGSFSFLSCMRMYV